MFLSSHGFSTIPQELISEDTCLIVAGRDGLLGASKGRRPIPTRPIGQGEVVMQSGLGPGIRRILKGLAEVGDRLGVLSPPVREDPDDSGARP